MIESGRSSLPNFDAKASPPKMKQISSRTPPEHFEKLDRQISEKNNERKKNMDPIRESRMASKLPRYRNARVVGTLLSVVSLRSGLLVHDLDLFVEHSAGVAIDGHMHPVMLFPFHNKIVLKIGCIGFEMT